MNTSLATLINLYAFSTGRRLFTFQQVRKVAAERGFDTLTAHADGAIKHDQNTRSLESKWAAEPAVPKAHGDLPRLDVQVDRTLVAIRDTTQAQIDGVDPDDAGPGLALRFGRCGPSGPGLAATASRRLPPNATRVARSPP